MNLLALDKRNFKKTVIVLEYGGVCIVYQEENE